MVKDGELVFKDQYLEISTRLPKDSSLYGLGENSQPHDFKLYPNDPYTLFTTEVSAINLNTDLYGSHSGLHGSPECQQRGLRALCSAAQQQWHGCVLQRDFSHLQGHWGCFRLLLLCRAYTAFIGRPPWKLYWSLGAKRGGNHHRALHPGKMFGDELMIIKKT
ncbi:putative alpha-xylosidase 2 [Pyrus x bretschneideri]|uniref:putative alpha-xylosidase 2 n=1 Tax=Pyrus x bretschneideri TaxID=225117 RepID=UPI00202F8E11|nr:putative alpha-xylosidase 2 [Pyrus x bretschneideri]